MRRGIFFLFIFFMSFMAAGTKAAAATDYLADYEPISYDSYDGLVSMQINTIAQTDDGYIWVGTYSGLYRYDGYRFEKFDIDDRICNVMRLFNDSKGRLWIGTNDSGLVCYDPGTGESRIYTTQDGLAADAVRSICEDRNGEIYVGTVANMSVIREDGTVELLDATEDTVGIRSVIALDDGSVLGVTNGGVVFLLRNGAIIDTFETGDEGVYFLSVSGNLEDGIIAGTTADYVTKLVVKGDRIYGKENITCGNAYYINDIMYDKDGGGYFYCAESGLGFIDGVTEEVTDLSQQNFVSSVSQVIKDYEGNIWFVSNKQGIVEFTPNPFTDIFIKAGLKEAVVNAVAFHKEDLYIGTDSGLFVVDRTTYKKKDYDFLERFDGVRVRHLFEDSRGSMWVSTYGKDGLVEIHPDGSISIFNESEGGTVGGRFRCCMELKSGNILAASNMGVNFINNDVVVGKLGEADGIVAQILTMVEDDDGSILIGSDGDGIYRIRQGRIAECIDKNNGLESLVVLRIVPTPDGGYIYVTSNALYYDNKKEIRRLKNFPYTNNYDVIFSRNGEVLVVSSAGIYVTKYEDLIADKEGYNYTILDNSRGFSTTPTANSWNETVVDLYDRTFYICCTDGVRCISAENYDLTSSEYNILINHITYDDEVIMPDASGKYVLPKGDGRVQILPAILNYDLTNPLVRLYMEGSGDEGFTTYHNNITPLNYTNMPYGDYTLHVQILDPIEGSVKRDETFSIYKEPAILELLWVRILLIVFAMMMAGYIVYRVIKTTTIARQVEQIREAKEEAERANSAKSRFLANMSHEIRTPINTIMGMDEMILREDKKAAGREYAQTITGYARSIKRASESLLSLVNDILDLSKIESGKMNLVEREYDVVDMLRGVCNMIRVRSADKGLSFITRIDEKLPKVLYADDGKIKQVVLNLLTNSVKYTEEGSFTLSVTVEEKNEENCLIKYEVSDTGIGIRPEDMDKLFSAFDRLDEKRNSGIQGTGLGLDISKKFALLMGDDLHVESVYGEGSTFYFTVRQGIVDTDVIGEFVEEEDETYEEEYVPLFVAPEGRVLVVDDSDMNLTVIKGLLSATGIRVDTATSGRECLDKLKKESYHVVFLDHMMPEMDGIETMHHIKEEGYDVPVYALTANAATSGGDYYVGEGFSGYLPKPVDGPLLEEAIRRHLPDELCIDPESVALEEEGTEDTGEGDIMEKLSGVEGMDVAAGIKACGAKKTFLDTVNMFYDTIEEKSKEIEDAFVAGDYEFLTIKVHALKTAARLVGFGDLSAMAEEMENAGKSGDNEYIVENTGKLLADFRGCAEKLDFLDAGENEDDDREPADPDMIRDAYDSIREMAQMMDYDSVEMIVDEMKNYRLEQEDAVKFKNIEKMLRQLDWDGIESIIEGRE